MTDSVLPTTDLYFLNSCHSQVRRLWRNGPVERLGANTFRSADRLLLVRRDRSDLMDRALEWPSTLVYLIDDDIDGAAQSSAIPAAYKARLANFAGHHDRLLRRADILVASSDVLATRLRADPRVRADIVRLDPFWALPFADQNHFSAPANDTLELVHLGTASHAGGLASITPAVIATLDRFPDTRFTYVGRPGSHPRLEAHPRVRRLEVMTWRQYRRWLPRQRFHLALYPLERTPFDASRSSNKLFEHAITGAVGLYSSGWPPMRMAGDGAIAAPPDSAQWTETLVRAVENRTNLAGLAKKAAIALVEHHDGTAQRNRWASILNLATDGQHDR